MAVGQRLAIAPAWSDNELTQLIEIRKRVDPKSIASLDELHHRLVTIPGTHYLVAELGNEPAGCAWVSGRDTGGYVHADVSVVPELRRRGIGIALHRAISDRARTAGKNGFLIETREDDPDSQGFLEHRGYVEVERQKALVLDLTTLDPSPPQPPPEITIVTRAERPEVVAGMFEVACEAQRDIPGLDGEQAPVFEEWRAHEIDRPSRLPEFTFVALVTRSGAGRAGTSTIGRLRRAYAAGDEVVGYAALDVFPAGVYHGLTAVRRAWRGRGIARALKLSQIAAAKAAGFDSLETESEARNVPMRRLNESLGYRPAPGMILYKGPLT